MADEGALILVVEDEALIAIDLDAILQDAGYRVLVANSVPAALEMVSHQKPDVAILDVNLGGSTTFDLADALSVQNIRLIFLTGHSKKFIPERLRDRPIIAKPFLPSVVLEAVGAELRIQASNTVCGVTKNQET